MAPSVLRASDPLLAISDMPDCWYTRPALAAFRASTAFNTLGVSGPHRPPDPQVGPDLDHVRLLWGPYRPPESPKQLMGLALFAVVLVALVAIVVLAR